jgi:hypothetical protein
LLLQSIAKLPILKANTPLKRQCIMSLNNRQAPIKIEKKANFEIGINQNSIYRITCSTFIKQYKLWGYMELAPIDYEKTTNHYFFDFGN